MRKICCFCCILLFLLSGCTQTNADLTNENAEKTENLFQMELVGECIVDYSDRLDSDDIFYYYRDTATDVLYICYKEYRKGGISVMEDPETGLPLTYTRYLKIQNNTK